MRTLRGARDRGEAVAATLETLCADLSAASGVAWVGDPAGEWRLAGTAGDAALAQAALADEPFPEPGEDGIVARRDDHRDEVLLRVSSWCDETAAVLRILRPRRVPALETEQAAPLTAAGEALGGALDRLAERDRAEREARSGPARALGEERDGLTGLLNRWAFLDRLQRAVEPVGSDVGAPVAVLVDIVGFRVLNDRLGWDQADRVLLVVAERLLQIAPDAVAAARLTGGRFALLFDRDAGAGDLADLGARIAAGLEPAELAAQDAPPVAVRVGVAASQDGCRSAEEVLRACASALEDPGGDADGRAWVFDPLRHGDGVREPTIEADLRRAVEQGQIELAYQPIVDLDSGRVTGLEALARWERPGHGPVSPVTFIPMAERTGLIRELGSLVLDRACRQLQAWSRAHPQAADWHLAVNLSAAQLDDPHLVEVVEEVLERTGLGHDRLVLEVTETTLSHDVPGALARLFELRRRGLRVAIDDFGTGYSSLARLRELPFDIVKIDRSFVQSIERGDELSPILQALLFMTQGLALDVVAEGVETATQLSALMAHRCGYVQGFLFSRPVAAGDLAPLLAGRPPWDIDQLVPPLPAPGSSALQQLLNGVVHVGGMSAEAALDELLQVLADLTDLESVYLTRVDLDESVQEVLSAANAGDLVIEPGVEVPWSQTLCQRAIADGSHVIADAPATYPDVDASGIRTYVGVGVYGARGRLRGTLCGVSSSVTEVSPPTVEALEWAARLLADPIEGRAEG